MFQREECSTNATAKVLSNYTTERNKITQQCNYLPMLMCYQMTPPTTVNADKQHNSAIISIT